MGMCECVSLGKISLINVVLSRCANVNTFNGCMYNQGRAREQCICIHIRAEFLVIMYPISPRLTATSSRLFQFGRHTIAARQETYQQRGFCIYSISSCRNMEYVLEPYMSRDSSKRHTCDVRVRRATRGRVDRRHSSSFTHYAAHHRTKNMMRTGARTPWFSSTANRFGMFVLWWPGPPYRVHRQHAASCITHSFDPARLRNVRKCKWAVCIIYVV